MINVGSDHPATVERLTRDARQGALGIPPSELVATSVFWVQHGTRLSGSDTTYRNQYVLVRVGGSFGASAFEDGEVTAEVCAEASGAPVDRLINSANAALRVAALDAYLGEIQPHRDSSDVQRVVLPAGNPEQRARARDEAIAGLLDEVSGKSVALIGVVNPLVAAIRERGAECLPCDLKLRQTQWGDPVTSSMSEVLERADAVVATGMTLSNGSFDTILGYCRSREIPLVVYAQTGSAVARAFLRSGVTALAAEPFPFSQFSAESTVLYRYRASARNPR